ELLAARVAAAGAGLVGQRDPRGLRQGAHRLRKREAILAHHEAERVAADPAAEAVEDALLRIDREGRGFLGVEGTQPLPVRSGLAEVHEPTHEIDDVDSGADVVEQRLRILHPQPTFSAATVAPVPPSDGSPSRKDSTRG